MNTDPRATANRLAPCRAFVILMAALMMGPAAVVSADTFTITSIVDFPDASPGDGLCRTTTGLCTLRAAIQEANALAGSDIIVLPAAGPHILERFGANENGAGTGDLDIRSTITIRGTGPSGAIIEGTDGWDDRILHLRSGGLAVLEFLTIRGGHPAAGEGGGILMDQGTTLTLNDSVVESNTASTAGGGISANGSLTVRRTIVRGNTARRGGGIVSRGGTTSLVSAEIDLNAATATAADLLPEGGGILVTGGSLSLSSSRVTRNMVLGELGQGGGGIKAAGPTASPPIVRLDYSTVADNTSQGPGGGGGIRVTALSTLTVLRSTISGNTTDANCGGIGNSPSDSATSVLQITNSTISGNHAEGYGGGVCHTASTASMEMNNVTIANNRADIAGGGLTVYSAPVRLANTIVAGNADNGTAPDCEGPLTSRGYNLIQNVTGCDIGGVTTGNITGLSARLGTLADNGGSTLTHMPSNLPFFMSPAIDAGSAGFGTTPCETTDQRRVVRPRDGNGDGAARCDIGAVER